MATGKTTSQYVKFIYNSQTLDCSITGADGIGIAYDETDVTGLCNAIKEALPGQGTVAINLSGNFSNTATTGTHTVLSALNGNSTGATLTIQIGIRAAATGGDPEFEVTNVGVFNYLVSPSGGNVTWTASLRPLPGATAAWGTV